MTRKRMSNFLVACRVAPPKEDNRSRVFVETVKLTKRRIVRTSAGVEFR